MNVTFHILSSIAIVGGFTDTYRFPQLNTVKKLATFIAIFSLGVISHGTLDYIPHAYPINSKADALIGTSLIIGLTFLADKPFKHIVLATAISTILPDLIDLLPPIIDK
ncbi:MAG: hypothetical protein EOP51_00865 [Sphingobacteriales bacterium]|nr:MAG: hypothetical protein EOP51_00865 [Sphingobacteriales bacterium]